MFVSSRSTTYTRISLRGRREPGATPTTRQEEVRRGTCDEVGDPKVSFSVFATDRQTAYTRSSPARWDGKPVRRLQRERDIHKYPLAGKRLRLFQTDLGVTMLRFVCRQKQEISSKDHEQSEYDATPSDLQHSYKQTEDINKAWNRTPCNNSHLHSWTPLPSRPIAKKIHQLEHEAYDEPDPPGSRDKYSTPIYKVPLDEATHGCRQGSFCQLIREARKEDWISHILKANLSELLHGWTNKPFGFHGTDLETAEQDRAEERKT
ncbi:hypothetical protein M5K25_009882 [Dendrobium thyrsiflorum]|uniref:Uncharacterized protein n=1 Tax=Dendrobium thyrsiflorum TaxID=117978 RepID=A0ABD0V7A1_DENTH